MDLNMTTLLFSENNELTDNDNFGDTALRLDCLGYGTSKISSSRDSQSNRDLFSAQAPDDGCRLVLGLGPTPSSYSIDCYSAGVNKNKESATVFRQALPPENGPEILKLGLSRGTEEFFGSHESSVSPQVNLSSSYILNQTSDEEHRLCVPIVDEGSTSAKKSGGYMPSLLLAPRHDGSKCLVGTRELEFMTETGRHYPHPTPESSATTVYSTGTISEPATGMFADHKIHHPKKCNFDGCSKGARGASGLCISHGGGQRCQKPGCNKGAESRTAYCKAHGGGRRCQQLGCTKSAEGRTDYCIAHGGGRRCGHPGCSKAARGKSGLCIRHGGGKRCRVEGCTRSAEGQAGLCISHGGGRRCQYPGCTKGAQGSTLHCKAHGGGKRCIFVGCTKGAEGEHTLVQGAWWREALSF